MRSGAAGDGGHGSPYKTTLGKRRNAMCKKVIVLATLLVSIGWLSSAALAQPPVKTGLVFWLDASNTGSLTLSGGKVARWNDLSGAGNYADQTAAAQQPTYLAGGL